MDLLSLAIEQSSEGIAVVDLDGNLKYLNEAFAEMHGYSSEELVGENLSIFHSPRQMPSVEAANQQIKKTGVFKGEIWHVRRDSTAFPTLMHNSLVRDSDGNPIAIVGTIRDITDMKRTEEALKKSEQKYRTLTENIRDGVYILDKRGCFTFVNDVIVRRSKQTREWFLGKTYLDVVRGEDHAEIRKKFEATMRGEDVPSYELAPEVSRDELWVEVNTTALRNEKEVIGLLGISRDISDRKLAEKRLENAYMELEAQVEKRTSELGKTTAQLNTLMNATTDTVVLIDLKGCVVAANAITAKRFGMSLNQFLGTCAYDLMPPSLARSRKAIVNRVAKTRKPYHFEDERGGIIFDSTVYPVLDDGGKVVQIAIYGKDITERKRSERALKKTKEDLRIKATSLEEMNTALKILLNTKDEDKREFEERILSNVKHLVMPYLGKMKKQITDENLKAYLHVLETNLSNIISPFSQKLSSKYLYLTITEIEIANLVKEGRNSKDIAEILGTSYKTIQNHRVNIRKKLMIRKKPISLRTYLLSLQ